MLFVTSLGSVGAQGVSSLSLHIDWSICSVEDTKDLGVSVTTNVHQPLEAKLAVSSSRPRLFQLHCGFVVVTQEVVFLSKSAVVADTWVRHSDSIIVPAEGHRSGWTTPGTGDSANKDLCNFSWERRVGLSWLVLLRIRTDFVVAYNMLHRRGAEHFQLNTFGRSTDQSKGLWPSL